MRENNIRYRARTLGGANAQTKQRKTGLGERMTAQRPCGKRTRRLLCYCCDRQTSGVEPMYAPPLPPHRPCQRRDSSTRVRARAVCQQT